MADDIETPSVICLRNYPESLFKVISARKKEMMDQKKRHVSYERVVIAMLTDYVAKDVSSSDGEDQNRNQHSEDHRQGHSKKGQ